SERFAGRALSHCAGHARFARCRWTPAKSLQIRSEAPERWRGWRRRRRESGAGSGQGREKVNLKQKIDNVATEESLQKGRARRFPLRESRSEERRVGKEGGCGSGGRSGKK